MRTAGNRQFDGASAQRVADRRRSRRRELREPTDVTILGVGKTDEWSVDGVLLNASADGIACRTEQADIVDIAVGRLVRVIFRIGNTEQPFDRHAQVISVTESGTPGWRVMGLEFSPDHDQPAERARLAGALMAACMS